MVLAIEKDKVATMKKPELTIAARRGNADECEVFIRMFINDDYMQGWFKVGDVILQLLSAANKENDE